MYLIELALMPVSHPHYLLYGFHLVLDAHLIFLFIQLQYFHSVLCESEMMLSFHKVLDCVEVGGLLRFEDEWVMFKLSSAHFE